jgi:hypothetical protein
VADDLIGQFWIELFQKVDGDPVSYESRKENQHGKPHEENEQENKKTKKLDEHIQSLVKSKPNWVLQLGLPPTFAL